jgi:hypothetical protein
LTIHPEAHVVAYTFMGEIGRAGGYKAIDPDSEAEVDALPARSQHYVHMKISPSGKRLAFVQTEKGESALKIGDLDGSNARFARRRPVTIGHWHFLSTSSFCLR